MDWECSRESWWLVAGGLVVVEHGAGGGLVDVGRGGVFHFYFKEGVGKS